MFLEHGHRRPAERPTQREGAVAGALSTFVTAPRAVHRVPYGIRVAPGAVAGDVTE
jgi:hypothetical protein